MTENNPQTQSLSDSTTLFWNQAAGLILTAIAYWIAMRIGLLFVAHPEGVASIWPASGLALAILLLNPKRQWAKFIAIIFVTNVAGNWSGSNSFPASLGLALANVLETLLGAWTLTYFCGPRITFARTLEIFALFGVAIISNGITALLGATVAMLAFNAPFVDTWLVWWTSDGLGIILVAPLIVTWAARQNALRSTSPQRLIEPVLLALVVAAFAGLLFGTFTVAEEPVLRNYMFFPILIWLAFRYSLRGMTIMLILFASIAILNTLQGYGIFAFSDQTRTEHLESVQMLLSVMAFSGLFLSAMLTELKQAEESLRESEDKFKYVFDNCTIGKSLTQPSGRLSANKALCDMLGYTEAELANKTWQEITHPDDIELTQREVDLLLSGAQNSTRFNKRYIHKTGSVVWVDLSTSIRRTKDGKPLYLMTSVVDITERKRVEDVIKEIERVKTELLGKLNDAQHLSKTGSWEWNLLTDQIWWSDETYRIFGVTQEDFVPSFEANGRFIHPEDLARYSKAFEYSLKTGEPLNVELRLVTNDSLLKYCQATGKIIYNDSDQPLRFVGTLMDITERKQMENDLVASNIFTHDLLTSMQDGLSVLDSNGVHLDVNPALCQITGFSREELIGVGMPHPYWPPEDYESIQSAFQKTLKGEASDFELKFMRKNGERFPVIVSPAPVKDREGSIISYTATVKDITERKRAEDAIKDSEKRFANIFRANPAAIALTRIDDGQLVDVNETWQEVTGYLHTEAVGHTPQELNIWVDPEQRKRLVEMLNEQGEARGEMQLCRKSGEIRDLLMSAEIIELGDKNYLLTMAQDITEHKQAENTLRESENKYRALVQNIQIGLVVHNPDTSILFSNQMASQLLGLTPDQMQGKKAIDPAWCFIQENGTRLPPEEYPVNQALAAEIPISNFILGILRPDREGPTWVQCNAHQDLNLEGRLQQIVVTFANITERKQAEDILKEYNLRLETAVEARTDELREAQEQLVRQEKLAVLGQLAGGVGHELRNPLAVINNAIYFLKLVAADKDEKVKEYLGIIETETRTAEKIIADLLDFARIKSVEFEPVSVHELICQTLERFPAPPSVHVNLDIPEGLPSAYIDFHQMTQVLGNLIINACQSMTSIDPDGNPIGGQLSLSARTQGDALIIAVQDSGVGILPENLKKIFEPLFTTKAKGIGLGLAVSQKLAEANGGRIEVESESGKGSTFTIYLPVKNDLE